MCCSLLVLQIQNRPYGLHTDVKSNVRLKPILSVELVWVPMKISNQFYFPQTGFLICTFQAGKFKKKNVFCSLDVREKLFWE